jgi:hypothetical protein
MRTPPYSSETFSKADPDRGRGLVVRLAMIEGYRPLLSILRSRLVESTARRRDVRARPLGRKRGYIVIPSLSSA